MSDNTKIILGLAAIAVIGSAIYIPMYRSTLETKNIVVENKERLLNVSGADGTTSTTYTYAVYADEVYHLSDTISFLHFSTYDVYNQIKVGMTCNVNVAGWRIPFLSMTKNIIKVNSCEKT